MSGNETNLPGRKSCPSMYTRHLHVPLGLCGNRKKKKKSGLGDGPFRHKWVKIWFVPKTRSQANPIKPHHPRRPSSLFRLENKLTFGGTTPCYTSQLKICIPPNKVREKKNPKCLNERSGVFDSIDQAVLQRDRFKLSQ